MMTSRPAPEKDFPLVSVIIPHWKGKEILLRCLGSLGELRHLPAEVLLIDNGSEDGSVPEAVSRFPFVRVLRSETNLGFAGGCNLGLEGATGEFALLLNDDAVVTEGLLEELIHVAQSDPRIAACQPKILSIRTPDTFDYAGAAGGEMDRYGFPFCRGRILDTCEVDKGQYDAPADIFWASGACCFVRVDAVKEVGLLDQDFFAHMEEIDLQWRLRNRGYRIVSVPTAVARHEAGSTLAADRPLKVYLNHRNSIEMLIKNQDLRALLLALPVRLALDCAAAVYRLAKGQPMNMVAVIRALFSVLFRLPRTLRKRRAIGPARKVSGFFPGSIVWQYFVLRRRTFSDLAYGPRPHG